MGKITSELDALSIISRKPKNPDAILGIGDDAAVIRGKEGCYAVTTDMLVEGDHFSLDYFSPRDIGIKAMESNVSDIAAMGARPLFAFVSIALGKDADRNFLSGFYSGIDEACGKYGIDVLGGDTTHCAIFVVNITVIGYVSDEKSIVRRDRAREGDLIFVTGELGASTAGLKLLLKKIDGFEHEKKKHRNPSSRLDVSDGIAKIANSMEDVSDGLASEVRNICIASRKGAVIFANKVPIAKSTHEAAKALGSGETALDFALFGGEDFELVFTVPPEKKIEAEKFGVFVGEINCDEGKIFLERHGKRELLEKFGYDHFSV